MKEIIIKKSVNFFKPFLNNEGNICFLSASGIKFQSMNKFTAGFIECEVMLYLFLPEWTTFPHLKKISAP